MIGGIIWALVFTCIGLLELALVNRSVYPSLRWRYEKAKLTQSQGMSPSTIMALVRFQSLVLMPVAGFLVGDRFSVADLTAAALLAPALCPEAMPAGLPSFPAGLRETVEELRLTPAGQWARQVYLEYR